MARDQVRRPWRWGSSALIIVFALTVNACAVAPTITTTTLVAGLYKPWEVAFTPDGAMLFTQKAQGISAVVSSQIYTLSGGPTDVVVQGEGGVMGLAVDPQFATNRFIYVSILSSAGADIDARVIRHRVSNDYQSLSDRVDILTGIPAGPPSDPGHRGFHIGGRLKFGPDGYLWVSTGDAHTPTAPQDPQSLAGKVLRIDRNGNGAPGNPGGAFRPEVYTKGHRNVQGIAFRPSDGKPFSVEHGNDCDDEVNELVPGGNYGWDPDPPPGTVIDPPFDTLGYWYHAPMTDTTRHPDARAAVWSSGCPTIAPSGATFVSGSQWGGWNGWLALAVLKGSHMRLLRLPTSAGGSVTQASIVSDHGRLRTAVQGPDGDLYSCQDLSTLGATIFKIHPSP